MSTILTQIMFGIQERARWRRYAWLWSLLVFSRVLSTVEVRGEGIDPEIALTKSLIIN